MPISVPLTPTITAAGLALAASLSGTGISLPLTHIGFGTGAYSPTGAETALHAEVQRVTIAGGGATSANSVQVYAQTIANAGAPYWCSEIGFYSNATLVAVFSRTSSPILYISDQIVTAIVYALGLAALPPNTVTVTVDPSASAALAALGVHVSNPNAHQQYVKRLNGVGVYDPLLTYGAQAIVIGDDGSLYQSLQANNIGNTPSASATWWGSVEIKGIEALGKINGVNSPNLLFNGSAEFGVAGWLSATGATLAALTGGEGEGTYFQNSSAISGVFAFASNNIPFAAGQPICLSGLVATPGVTAGSLVMQVVFLNSSLGLISSLNTPIVNSSGSWTPYIVSGTTPAGTAFAYAQISGNSASAISVSGLDWRRMKLEAGTTPSLYSQEASVAGIPGSSPGVPLNFLVAPATLPGHAPQLAQIQAAIAAAFAAEAGKVGNFAMSAPPVGWLKANGAAVSRTAYANLFAQIGTFYGAGDGATTFNLPDYRGEFLRGFDDGRGVDSGRAFGSFQADVYASHAHGVTDPTHAHSVSDPGHAHSVSDPGHAHGVSDPGHGHGVSDSGHAHGVPYGASPGSDTATVAGPGASNAGTMESNVSTTGIGINSSGTGIGINGAGTGIGIYGAGTGIGIYGAATGISIQASGSNETRPRNKAVLVCIKY